MRLENLLGVFAHPDDEAIMVGGTLALLHERGVRTHVVCATRGEGGEMGEPPVVADRSQLGAAREAELRCALVPLGVASLTLLDYVDPEIGPEGDLRPFEADFERLVAQIAHLIAATQADVILAHGPDGEYGHPAHRLIYRATRAAVERSVPGTPLYSLMATVPGLDDHIWNKTRLAHLALDITPWAEAKIAAMECHISQHALFRRRRKLKTVREAVRLIESFYREWPNSGDATPDDPFATLLREAGAQTPEGH
jgi:LmbE family N-acetylglucosaminyl deacetylase